MKLYSIHCGFYNSEVGQGIYESHINLFVVAESFEDARKRAKELDEFKKLRMHIDGIQEINRINGFDIECNPNTSAPEKDIIHTKQHRDLSSKSVENSI